MLVLFQVCWPEPPGLLPRAFGSSRTHKHSISQAVNVKNMGIRISFLARYANQTPKWPGKAHQSLSQSHLEHIHLLATQSLEFWLTKASAQINRVPN